MTMVQGLKFLSKKSFHPQNRSNQKRVWEREQEKHQEQTRIREREAQLRREREDEELAIARGDTKLQFLYKPPPGLIQTDSKEANLNAKVPADTQSTQQVDNSLFERQPGDDDAAAAFRRLLAGQTTESTQKTDEVDANSLTASTATTFGTVLQGSNMDRSDAPKPVLSALEQSVGRKKHQNLTFDEQIQRFPALANAPRAKGVSATDVGVTFQPLGTQIRNVRCLACGIWGHSRGDRECSKTGWDPFATTTTSSLGLAKEVKEYPSVAQKKTMKRAKRRKDNSSSSSSDDSYSSTSSDEERRRRHKRYRNLRDRSPSRKKRKEKKKSKTSRKQY
ncbi:CBF1 interacting corepressor [Fistulifera solaris]|jgi:CBF1 interacting corepressor|uniref:CBF1 interacting corepressor n=1 Tax=Fistulifera solaris TaxID=1519565 RepID=A0A1Z5JIV9_FISSO|nr:CBF1 interacting corepressor [Fistulifera solaris]|eukprot:GAX13718.1 CBF1 interacting corepressor [Fistulifera solaris]